MTSKTKLEDLVGHALRLTTIERRSVYIVGGIRAFIPDNEHDAGGRSSIHQLAAVWLDLEVAGWGTHGERTKKDVPYPAADECGEIVRQIHATLPSVGLKTGGGLHFWWLASSPLAHTEAVDLMARWKQQQKNVAEAAGRHIDHSVARPEACMRLPGSVNWKDRNKPQFVEVKLGGFERHDLRALAATLPEPVEAKRVKGAAEYVPGVRYSEPWKDFNANPQPDHLLMMLERSGRPITDTWQQDGRIVMAQWQRPHDPKQETPSPRSGTVALTSHQPRDEDSWAEAGTFQLWSDVEVELFGVDEPGAGCSPSHAWAVLFCDGDHHRANAEIRELGYGATMREMLASRRQHGLPDAEPATGQPEAAPHSVPVASEHQLPPMPTPPAGNAAADTPQAAASSADDEWPEREEIRNPIDLLPDANLDLMPDVIASTVRQLAAAAQVPESMVLGQVLAAISAACTGKLLVRTKWDEPAVLYSVNVAESGARKSPVHGEIFGPLRERQTELVLASKQERELAEIEYDAAKRRLETAKKAAADSKNLSSAEERRNGILVAYNEAEKAKDGLKPAPLMFVDDITPEKLEMVLAEQRGSISVASDEPGVFGQMIGKYRDNGAGKQIDTVWLAGYSKGDISTHRVGREPVAVSKIGITLAVFAQPGIAAEMLRTPELRDRGLHARVWWTLNRALTGYRQTWDAPAFGEPARLYWSAFIQMLADSADKLDRWTPVAVSDEAIELYRPVWERIEHGTRPGERFATMADWAGKAHGLVLRFAAMIHAANNPTRPAEGAIDADEMRAAIELFDRAAEHAEIVYTQLGAVLGFSRSQEIVKVIGERIRRQIEKHGLDASGTVIVERAELWRALSPSQRKRLFADDRGKPNAERLDEALDDLAEVGWARRHETAPANTGPGRPKLVGWEIHPDWLAEILDPDHGVS